MDNRQLKMLTDRLDAVYEQLVTLQTSVTALAEAVTLFAVNTKATMEIYNSVMESLLNKDKPAGSLGLGLAYVNHDDTLKTEDQSQ